MLEVPPHSEKDPMTAKSSAPVASMSRRLLRGIGFLLVIFAFLMTLYGVVGYIAWQRGQNLRAERARTDLQEQMWKQMSLAREDIEVANYILALRRLEWVLEQDPNYPGALLLHEQAQLGLDQILTPASTATVTPLPTATTIPDSEVDDPVAELVNVQRLVDGENWAPVIEALITFQSRFPNYERLQTDQMLYDAYISLGLSLLSGDQIELGLYYLDQAERLGDLPEAVTDQRVWAELYLLGIAFYGVDWGAAVFYFRDLCRAAPYFHNACDKLYEALVAHGDQYAALQDWCPAQQIYGEARQNRPGQAISEKLNEAIEGCLSATPIPSPTPESEESEEPIDPEPPSDENEP